MKPYPLFRAGTFAAALFTISSAFAQLPPLSAADFDATPRVILMAGPSSAIHTLEWWGGNGRVYLGFEESVGLPGENDSHMLHEWAGPLSLTLRGSEAPISLSREFVTDLPDRAFYRLRYFETAGVNERFRDTDSDGIDDLDELRRGTDPQSATLNADGLPADWVAWHFESLTYTYLRNWFAHNSDPAADPDYDGLDNLAESQAGTDPISSIVYGTQRYLPHQRIWAAGILQVAYVGETGSGYLGAEFDDPAQTERVSPDRLRSLRIYPNTNHTDYLTISEAAEPQYLQASYDRAPGASDPAGALVFTGHYIGFLDFTGRDHLRSVLGQTYGRREVMLEGVRQTLRVPSAPAPQGIRYGGVDFAPTAQKWVEDQLILTMRDPSGGWLWAVYADPDRLRRPALEALREIVVYPSVPGDWTPSRHATDYRQARYSRASANSPFVFQAFTAVDQITGTDQLGAILGVICTRASPGGSTTLTPAPDVATLRYGAQEFAAISQTEKVGAGTMAVWLQGDGGGYAWATYDNSAATNIPAADLLLELRLFPAVPLGWTLDPDDRTYRQARYTRTLGNDGREYLAFTPHTQTGGFAGRNDLRVVHGQAWSPKTVRITGAPSEVAAPATMHITSLPPPEAMEPGVFPIIVRDFPLSDLRSPDFRSDSAIIFDPGLVLDRLGTDGLPVLSFNGPDPLRSIKNWASFDRWFRRGHALTITKPTEGPTTIQGEDYPYGLNTSYYYPLIPHLGTSSDGGTYCYTTELRFTLKYVPGVTKLALRANDSAWVFINGKLAIDRGGREQPQTNILSDLSEFVPDEAETCEVAVFYGMLSSSTTAFSVYTTTEAYPTVLYQVIAESASASVAGFRLLEAPNGMKIDPVSGKISWSLVGVAAGAYPVTVLVENEAGAADTQSFDITIENSFPSP